MGHRGAIVIVPAPSTVWIAIDQKLAPRRYRRPWALSAFRTLTCLFLYSRGEGNGGIRDGRQWAECGRRLREGGRAAGTVKAFAVGSNTLAVYNIDGAYYITDNECTHAAASLADGMLDGDVIECCMHLGSFHVPTGDVVAPPCEVPLRTYKVVIEGDDVFVDLAHNAAGGPQ